VKHDASRPDGSPEPQSPEIAPEGSGGDAAWARLGDDDLLQKRIADLKLKLEHTPLAAEVASLQSELEARGLALRPHVYLGDEWFSPEGLVAIAVPFYLAHPRLVALERKLMLEVEGGTQRSFRKLLRHEAGHCFDHAFGVSKRQKWRQVFGSPEQDYAPETYRPRPYSRSFVRHLDNWYAQAHPDEDFAETFAVWLDPDSDWRTRYADWPVALAKLRYVDALAHEFAGKAARLRSASARQVPYSAARMRTTLANYYARRRRENAEDYPDFYDADLRRIFDGPRAGAARERSAERFMRAHRKAVLESVSHWTGERKFTAHHLVRKLSSRCASLDLRVGDDPTRTALELSSYLAALVSNYLFTGKFKRRV
jgi:hypothetical protein